MIYLIIISSLEYLLGFIDVRPIYNKDVIVV